MSSSASLSSSTHAIAIAKVPLLATSSGAAGSPYAVWRVQMQTYLERNSIDHGDYMEPIAEWKSLVAVMQRRAKVTRSDTVARYLSLASAADPTAEMNPSHPRTSLKAEADLDTRSASSAVAESVALEREVCKIVDRSRKAYAALIDAVTPDVRALVADVPIGYAYGVWSFLEKRYRNTENDSVGILWREYSSLRHQPEETFDQFKARVDAMQELLVHANQSPQKGHYLAILIWTLSPRYTQAILALTSSGKLKDPNTIVWSEIAEYMAQFERSQEGLTDEASSGRAMVARSQTPMNSGRPLSEMTCFNCQKKGHMAHRCPAPDRQRHPPRDGKWKKQGPPGKKRTAPARRTSHSDSDDDESLPASGGAAFAMSNRYDSLSEDDGPEPLATSYFAVVPTSYAAVAAAAASSTATSPAAKSASPPSSAKVPLRDKAGNVTVPPKERPPAPKSLHESLRTTARAIDTGATTHITCSRDSLVNVKRCVPLPIRMADGTVLTSNYSAECKMRLAIMPGGEAKNVTVTFRNVYYHERFDANLLSWDCMRKDGWKLKSTQDETIIVTPKGHKIKCNTKGGLTVIDDSSMEYVYGARKGNVVCSTAKEVVQMHRRLGHASWKRLIAMSKTGSAVGIGNFTGMAPSELRKAERAVKECTACIQGKAHSKPKGVHGLDKGGRAGEVLHFDTFWATTRDAQGRKVTSYCLLGIDSYTEYRSVSWQIRWLRRSNTSILSLADIHDS